jgi:L-seryl-tRNA(Ser) seleniumtransferase
VARAGEGYSNLELDLESGARGSRHGPRAERLAAAVGGEIVDATAKVGGVALPLLKLPDPAVALTGGSPDALAARLRAADPPVVGRIEAGRLLLDPRTLADDEIPLVARALS